MSSYYSIRRGPHSKASSIACALVLSCQLVLRSTCLPASRVVTPLSSAGFGIGPCDRAAPVGNGLAASVSSEPTLSAAGSQLQPSIVARRKTRPRATAASKSRDLLWGRIQTSLCLRQGSVLQLAPRKSVALPYPDWCRCASGQRPRCASRHLTKKTKVFSSLVVAKTAQSLAPRGTSLAEREIIAA